MAGFREFMPGQVWFYYNPHATKAQEKVKELGYVTCRPVVIIQSAFYPEWNDIVAVVPMTHSDRRSGIPIDTTILKDGGIIEGGTVLPYLIYSIKTKFLFPMMTQGSNRRRLISLSDEDFEKVMEGVKYHLGFSPDVPEYVANWKKIPDYDRNVVIKQVQLAISDCDTAFKTPTDGDEEIDVDTQFKKNPTLYQQPSEEHHVENHVLAAFSSYDRQRKKLYDPSACFTTDKLGHSGPPKKGKSKPGDPKKIKRTVDLGFTKMGPETFTLQLESERSYVDVDSKIYKGSDFLANVQLKFMPALINDVDAHKIMTLPIREILECTGLTSSSTVSRLRSLLRGRHFDLPDLQPAFTQDPSEAPDPFIYTATYKQPRSRNRRNQLRYHALFQLSNDEMRTALTMEPEDLAQVIGLSASVCRQLKVDITTLHPSFLRTPEDILGAEELPDSSDEAAEANVEAATCKSPEQLYELWETLSPAELNEIQHCHKKDCSSIAKNFGLTKTQARQVRGQVISIVKKAGREQPPIDQDKVEDAILKMVNSSYEEMSTEDLMIFCRSDPQTIADVYTKARCANTPAKGNIRGIKLEMRKLIVKDI